jgi:hypothetical protein
MRNYELYILKQPSSCSTSRICPSWPRCRLRLSLLLVSLQACILLPCPTQYLAIYLNGSGFTPNAFLVIWVASHWCTSKQHNKFTRYTCTYIYISHWHYYSSLLPTLLLLSLAGRLVQTLSVWHNSESVKISPRRQYLPPKTDNLNK